MSDLRSHFMIIDFEDNIQRDVMDPWIEAWADTKRKFEGQGIYARMRTHTGGMKDPVKSLKIEFNCYAERDKPETYRNMLVGFIQETVRIMPVNPIAKIAYSRGFPGVFPSYSVEHLP